jgi:hypothetical protein
VQSQEATSEQPLRKSFFPSSFFLFFSSFFSLANQHVTELTMEVVAHLQRIADRTGDALLHETARKAHSACAKNLNEAPGGMLRYLLFIYIYIYLFSIITTY